MSASHVQLLPVGECREDVAEVEGFASTSKSPLSRKETSFGVGTQNKTVPLSQDVMWIKGSLFVTF